MSIFRSEEHVRRWTQQHSYMVGAIVPLAQVWTLAMTWYTDPRSPGWRPRSRDESQSVIASVGLVGDFWELPR
jgi:alkylmercury lyase-like protein